MMFTVASTVPLIIYAIYTPILVLLYLTQVVIVILNKRKEQFRSSYFSLFIIGAISGIGANLASLVKHKLPIFPEVNSFYADFPINAFTTGLYFASYYFIACQNYADIFIALNRLSSITFYNRYEQIWRRVGWLCIPVIFGFPFISYYHLVDVRAFPNSATFKNITIYWFDYDHSVRPWRSNRTQAFYLYLICSIIALSLNLASIVVLRCTSMEKVSSIEVRLFLLGFTAFVCGLPMTIQQLLFVTGSSPAESIGLGLLIDLKSLSPAILSIIFSAAIRKELIQLLRRGRAHDVSSVTWLS